jgi:hypothetical protein
MPKVPDWIPTRNDDIYNKLRSYLALIIANKLAWGIADVKIDALTTLQTEFEPLYEKIQDKRLRTSSDVTAFNDCKKRLLTEWRAFHKENVRGNRSISPADLSALVGKEYDTEPSPGKPITDRPITALRNLGGGDMAFGYKTTHDQTRYSIHPDATEVEYRLSVVEPGDIPPDDFENYAKQASSTRAKFTVKLGSKNIGKRLYVVSRWVNKHRPIQEGPWTTPTSEVIA